MGQIGIGAMLHYLVGGSEKDPQDYYGEKIVEAKIEDEKLIIKFENGKVINLFDDGKSCCEMRYMTCDDDPKDLVGGVLREITPKNVPTIEEDWDVHEQVFVEVATDKGFITLCSHNEHNGYYGGFGLTITEEKAC